MKTIIDFFTSETFGFLLKLFSGLAAAGFGILGIGTETRDKQGKLTRNGWIALVGIVLAGLLAIGTSVYEFAAGQKRAEEAAKKSEQLMLSIERGLYPMRGMKVSAQILIDNSFPGAQEYKRLFKQRIANDRFCKRTDPAFNCQANGDINGPNLYVIPISSGLFPAKGSALFAAINRLLIKFTIFRVIPSGKAGSGSVYKEVGHSFKFYWSDRLPADTILSYDSHDKAPLTLFVNGVELASNSLAGSDVYSLIDFMPGMMAVAIDFDPMSVCAEVNSDSEDCAALTYPSMFKAFSISDLSMVFPHPKGMRMDPHFDIKCQFFGRTYLALRFANDIDSDTWFSSERLHPYTLEQKNAACAAIDASIPERDRYSPGDPVVIQ